MCSTVPRRRSWNRSQRALLPSRFFAAVVGSTRAGTSSIGGALKSTERGYDMISSSLKPAAELARASNFRFPNESDEYRRARDALLVEEIELTRHIERVAEQRRALPPGGEVKTQTMPSRANKDRCRSPTCSGPKRRSWSTTTCSAHSASGRVRCALRYCQPGTARCPTFNSVSRWRWWRGRRSQRLIAFKRERGWHHLPLYSDLSASSAAITTR